MPTRSRPIFFAVCIVALLPLASALFIKPLPAPSKPDAARSAAGPRVTVQPSGTYAIDAVIVGTRSLAPGSGPVTVTRGEPVFIAGWALDPGGLDEADGLAASIDGGPSHRLGGYGMPRPDVAAALQLPDALQSGFRSQVLPSRVRPGRHVIRLSVVTGADRRSVIPMTFVFDLRR